MHSILFSIHLFLEKLSQILECVSLVYLFYLLEHFPWVTLPSVPASKPEQLVHKPPPPSSPLSAPSPPIIFISPSPIFSSPPRFSPLP